MSDKMRVVTILFLIVGVVSCSAPSPLERALKYANNNRGELEKVLEHYSRHEKDSLKYKAACFLIENMPYHYSYGGHAVEKYYKEINPLVKQSDRFIIDSIKKRLKHAAGCLSINRSNIEMDITHVNSEFLIRHIDRIFLTREYPWNKNVSFQDFCEYVLPYRINNEPLEDWLPIYTLASKPIADTLYEQSGSYREFIEKIVDFYTDRSPYIRTYDFPIENYPSSLLNIRYGTCHEITMWGVYIFRALGIPVYIDFTPNWANRSKGHNWNGITIDGVYYPFIFQDYTTAFGDHLKDRFYEKFSKIYRRTYSLQKESLFMRMPDEKIPGALSSPFLQDISNLYGAECSDVTIALNAPIKKHIAYILVFNNREWTPVGWAKISDGCARFCDVHKNCCYLAATFDGTRFTPISNPFIIDDSGSVKMLEADKAHLQNLVMHRKYPLGSMQKYAERSVGGEFHGSNNADFNNYEILYVVGHTLDDMKWHTVSVVPHAFKFLRYYSAKGGYNSMAEINFIAENGDVLTGEIIGEGELLSDKSSHKENAFDGDPLTFFAAKDPDDSWVGLKLAKKATVHKIKYLFRNDDNNVRRGDLYELFYWDGGQWNSLGIQTGKSDSLVYANCPTNALFILRNHTRGSEERIFSYADDKQTWW